MNDPLWTDVHPATSRHLTVVGHSHLFSNFPVAHVVILTDQETVGNDDTRSFWFRFEEAKRVTRFNHQGLVFCHDFQVFLDQVVLHPVGTDRSCFPISDQFIWIKSNFKAQVVVNHDLHSLSSCAFSFVLINWFSVDPIFWTEAIAIDPTASSQFFQKFWDQLLVEFFRNVTQSIFKGNFSLSLR